MYLTTALLPGNCLFWLGAAYKLQLAKLQQQTAGYCLQRRSVCLVIHFWGFCSIIPGVARRVRPHPGY